MLESAQTAYKLNPELLDAKIVLGEALVETGKGEALNCQKIIEGVKLLHEALSLCKGLNCSKEFEQNVQHELRLAEKVLFLKQFKTNTTAKKEI